MNWRSCHSRRNTASTKPIRIAALQNATLESPWIQWNRAALLPQPITRSLPTSLESATAFRDTPFLTLLPIPTWRWATPRDRKSTRLNSSHLGISYAVFCLKKKKKQKQDPKKERPTPPRYKQLIHTQRT